MMRFHRIMIERCDGRRHRFQFPHHDVQEHRPMPRVARVDQGAETCGYRRLILQAWEL
jgi:hypothetical protein